MNEESKKILAELTPEERNAAISILTDIAEKGNSKALEDLYYRDYDEIPVDIDTFIENDRYIGKFTGNGTLIYPYWREKLREMFDDENYQEVALTGSIGIGKSTIACIAMAYLLYKTMCLRDPQEYFRLAAGSTIVFAFFNNTLDLTNSVGYGTIQNMVQNSPWFLERGIVSGTKNKEYVPNKLIRFRVGSQASHALGTNIISAMIDEVNFKQGANVRMEQSKIMETYNGVLERMGSRFMVNGKIAGKLFIVSSKKSEYDFLESYIRKKANDPTVMVCDAKLWEVKPMGTYSGQTFKVAVGGSNLPSKIVEDGEDIDYLIERGYEIIEPPVEFKGRFEMDINAALMNIAGISISHVTKFIPYTIIEQCYSDKNKNPFTQPILEIGMHDQLKISDFFLPELVSSQVFSRKLFIHIDSSLTGDKTGIGCTAVMGFRDQDRYDDKSGNTVRLKEFVYKHVFSVDIKAPKGSEISFQKTREFIYYLKYVLNWNICGISLDGFQSADSRQQLETAGFKATIVSLDRSPNGYLAFRSALAEKRISMIKIPFLETEIIRLERDNMTGKIDHPLDGSKDMSDGLAGSLYNASISVSPEEMYNMEDYSVIMEVNPVLGVDISDNPANDMFDFVPKEKEPARYVEINPLEEEVNKDISEQDNIVKNLRNKLSASENRKVSDDELLGALFNKDDSIIIF